MIEASLCRLHYPYISDTDRVKVTMSFLFKLDAYLRSPGLSVGNKLHFWACICLSFFYAIIGLPRTFFSLGMPEMQLSHICLQS